MEKNAKIYVAGHRGMVGSAIVRELNRQGYTNIITRTHQELDLTRQADVEEFFAAEKPEYVFLAAAKVGGIIANQNALADFMWFNMTLEMNEKCKYYCQNLLSSARFAVLRCRFPGKGTDRYCFFMCDQAGQDQYKHRYDNLRQQQLRYSQKRPPQQAARQMGDFRQPDDDQTASDQ